MTRIARRKTQHFREKRTKKKDDDDPTLMPRMPEEATPWSVMVAPIRRNAIHNLKQEIKEEEREEEKEEMVMKVIEKEEKDQKGEEGTQVEKGEEGKQVEKKDDGEQQTTVKRKKKKKKKVKKVNSMSDIGNVSTETNDNSAVSVESNVVNVVEKDGAGKKKKKKKKGKGKKVAVKSEEGNDDVEVKEVRKRKGSDDESSVPQKRAKQNDDGTKSVIQKIREQAARKHDSNEPYTFTKFCGDGSEVQLGKFEGYSVTPEDAQRLTELKSSLMSRGMPRETVFEVMKLERRKAEKLMKRVLGKVCFRCRKPGHTLSQCPELSERDEANNLCYICGSANHSINSCPSKGKKETFDFAKCFVCGEQGHISRQCPQNPKGIYPRGGACLICGDVTHLRRDCPTLQKSNQEHRVTADRIARNSNLEDIDATPIPFLPDKRKVTTVQKKEKKKVVNF